MHRLGRYIASLSIVGAMLISCTPKELHSSGQDSFVPNTLQEEFEHIAMDVFYRWNDSGSAVSADAFAHLVKDVYAKDGIIPYPGGRYKVVNSADAQADVNVSRSRETSPLSVVVDGRSMPMPSELTAAVDISNHDFGTVTVRITDDNLTDGYVAGMVSEGTDKSLLEATIHLKSNGGRVLYVTAMDVEVSFPNSGSIMSMHDSGSCEIKITDDAMVLIPEMSVLDYAADFVKLREAVLDNPEDRDSLLASFNAGHSLHVYLKGVKVGDSRAEFFSDETGENVDIVIHYPSENVSNSIPPSFFDRVLSLPDFILD